MAADLILSQCPKGIKVVFFQTCLGYILKYIYSHAQNRYSTLP